MTDKTVRHSKCKCDNLIYVCIVKGSPSLSKLTHSSGLYIYLFLVVVGGLHLSCKRFYLFIVWFLAALGLCCCSAFSSCGEQRLLFIAMLKLLVRVASYSRAQALEHRIIVVVHGLGCPQNVGSFLDQGSNLCPLHWQVDSEPLDHQGRSLVLLL